jgi:ribosome recycling factor
MAAARSLPTLESTVQSRLAAGIQETKMKSGDYQDIQRRMDGAINAFKTDLASLRTGRASSNLLDAVQVKAYGGEMPLNQVANVTVPEARMISVSVWDKSMVSAVDRAIREANLGFNPIVDGQNLRIPLPELNEQRRKELVKLAHTYGENARVSIRHVRRDGMDFLKKAEKDGDISEDDHRKQADRVQKLTDETISQVDSLLTGKEAEIMQV